jgi:hypothetical protein
MNPMAPTITEQEDFFRDFELLFQREEKAIIIMNSKNQKLISSEARIRAGLWLKQNETNMANHLRVIIFIEGSIWLQMVIKAIFMIKTPPVPTHALKDLAAAKLLLNEKYYVKI